MADRRRARRTLAGLLPLLAAACGPPALVRDGRPEGVIVAAPGATGDEALAATELRDYLAKISGATLEIVAAWQPSSERAQVRIGVHGQDPVRGWPAQAPPPDGFALRRVGRELWIVGGDARGALNGVYDLLETDLGVRWFMPG